MFLSVSTCLHGMLILLDDVEWMIVGGVIIRAIQGVSGTVMQVSSVLFVYVEVLSQVQTL